MRLLRWWPCLVATTIGWSIPALAQDVPRIAAASDLRPALSAVAAAFRRQTGQRVSPTFGSSGTFYQQIRHGAPFQLFLSADEGHVRALASAGRTVDAGALYAIGRLAIVAPIGSPLVPDSSLAGLRRAVQAGRITRLAIANPDHAPYGARAREALQHARLWRPLAGRIVLGENVSQAMQFATSGSTQGGIVAFSLTRDPALVGRMRVALIPPSWHRPLRQRMVLMKGAGVAARQFYRYLRQPLARRILARHGFTIPGAG